jgi:NhaA family Na+:H+ antiporter
LTAAHHSDLNEPVSRQMHQDFTSLRADFSIAQTLEWLRQHPPKGRIIYFYVVDADGILRGVVPARRLIVGAPDAKIGDLMVAKVIALPSRATVLEACELFILHRLLAFPVVDEAGRLVGVVDIDLYTSEFNRLDEWAPALRWLRPLTRFMHIESAGGIVLMACTLVAMVLANSPWASAFAAFWQTKLGVEVGSVGLTKPLFLWINDGLMTLFFFVVGLEIKREVVTGELNDRRKVTLPLVAALGGMIAPACIYLALQWGQPTVHGWGVPTATDIAFVVGFLVLLGPRVPAGLKVLLLSLAIADDIGAVLVIALAYNAKVALGPLLLGFMGLAGVLLFRCAGVRHLLVYSMLGAAIWVCFLKSGIHPTVAGVALGLMTPTRPWLGDRTPINLMTDLLRRLGGLHGVDAPARQEPFSPLERLERNLHPWVAFLIMPVFALANAGVAVEPASLAKPVALAIAAGLVFGKPIGIVLLSMAAVRVGLAKLPSGVNFPMLIGAGCLAGIGFTMSLFIAGLAFDSTHLDEAKIGILAGSALSAALGLLLVRNFLPPRETPYGP